MSWVPQSAAIWTALLAGLAAPSVLLLLRWGPAVLRGPGTRFRVAVAVATIVWFAGLVLTPWNWGGAIGGGLFLLAALIALFMVWSVLVWGFTLNLLLAIARHDGPVTLERWLETLLGAGGEARFARDRLALIEKRGIVTVACDRVTIGRGTGRLAVRLMMLGTWFFGPQAP